MIWVWRALNSDYFETVTVTVPRSVMDFLRKTEKNPLKIVEYSIVDGVRKHIEGINSMKWAEFFGLQPLFANFLNDSRYKKTTEN